MFEKLSRLLCIYMILIMIIFSGLISDGINGLNIMIPIYILIVNPITNILKQNRKYVKNVVYNLMLILLSTYNIIIYCKAIILYLRFGYDSATMFIFDEKLIISFLLFFILFVVTLFLPKEEVNNIKNNNRLLLVVTALICLLPVFNSNLSLSSIVGYGISFLSLFLCLKYNSITDGKVLKRIYLLLIFMSLISCNFAVTIILLFIYYDLNKWSRGIINNL